MILVFTTFSCGIFLTMMKDIHEEIFLNIVLFVNQEPTKKHCLKKIVENVLGEPQTNNSL